MKAAILTIGDELLTGKAADTNAQFLAEHLTLLGVEVVEIRSVSDEPQKMHRAIQELSGETELLLTTGGLGPTCDDLTREVFAKELGQELIESKPAKENLEAFYGKRSLPVNAMMLKQAKLPNSTTLLANPKGSAAGFSGKLNGCRFFTLPGVPSEMRGMFETAAMPMLEELLQSTTVQKRHVLTVRLLGIAESTVQERLGWLTKFADSVRLGIQIRFPELMLHFYSQSTKAFAEIEAWAKEELNDYLVDFNSTPAEELVQRLCQQRGLTLATAESCTGGYLSSRLLALPGASKYFLGGAIVYSNAAKVARLGVSDTTLAKQGAVSEACALEMARGAKMRHKADIALSTTGILGPGGGTYDKPVGVAFAAIVTEQHEEAWRFQLKRNRILNRQELTVRLLFKLKEQLEAAAATT